MQFGGHPRAAGFTLETTKIERFRNLFSTAALAQAAGARPERRMPVDARLRLQSITPRLVDLVEQFQPIGEGNPTPTFVSRATLLSREPVGDGPLRLRLDDGQGIRRAIWFKPGELPADGSQIGGCGLV